jgi:acyl-CoA hydrolase
MMPKLITPDTLASMLPPGGLTLVSGCSAESLLFADAVEAAGSALGAMIFCQVVVGGLNRRSWYAGPESRILTFFQTPVLRDKAQRVEFLPLCYQDALIELRCRKPAAALLMCTPPDTDGLCSFGSEVSFIADLWREIPIRIAHINPLMPRTSGDPGIPFDELSAYFLAEQPLLSLPTIAPDAISIAVGNNAAAFVRDDDALQIGIGKLPDAVARALIGRKHLKIHSGLLGDGLMDLIDSGSVDRAVVGTAIGSTGLYSRLHHPILSFQPTSITHGPRLLAAIDRLVTINSALQVDLFGQCYSEMSDQGLMSGPGGASDFSRGARAGVGVRIIAIPATARSFSRIVPPSQGRGPVSLSRFDVDVIVTEHGAADLRGLGYDDRANALIAIAEPANRDKLAAAWAAYSERM